MAIEPRNALVPENCLSKELGRVIEMEFLGDLPGFKSPARIPKISNSRLLRRSVGERRIPVAIASAQSVVVQLAKLLLADTTSALASASASSILADSLPPPRALSGRPPPFPPTIGAIC